MQGDKRKRYTIAILVNNRSGVLMRVVGLFSRRGYNIDSLSVGETEDSRISRITIVLTASRDIVEQIKRQVEKLVDVKRVFEMTAMGSVQRELVMVKLRADEKTRPNIVEVGEIFKAKILDVTPSTVTLMLTGSLEKLDSFLELTRHYGIVELARTGITALERGSRGLTEVSPDENLENNTNKEI